VGVWTMLICKSLVKMNGLKICDSKLSDALQLKTKISNAKKFVQSLYFCSS